MCGFVDQCTDIIGDRGLRQLGTHCRNLRRLLVEEYEAGFVTQHGLMAVAKGCFSLEKITFYAADMTSEVLATLANNCPNLYDVRICLVQKYDASHPVRPSTSLLRRFREPCFHLCFMD